MKIVIAVVLIVVILCVISGIQTASQKAAKRAKEEEQEAKRRKEDEARINNLRDFADQLLEECAKRMNISLEQLMEDFSRGESMFYVNEMKLSYGKSGQYRSVTLYYNRDMGVSLIGGPLHPDKKLECIAQRIAERIPVETELEYKRQRYEVPNPDANTYQTTVKHENSGHAGTKTVYTTTKTADTLVRYNLDSILITAKNKKAVTPKVRVL